MLCRRLVLRLNIVDNSDLPIRESVVGKKAMEMSD
jgi:hypothetical protein